MAFFQRLCALLLLESIMGRFGALKITPKGDVPRPSPPIQQNLDLASGRLYNSDILCTRQAVYI